MIFISYRRLDNQYLAAGVRDAIIEQLSPVDHVFFDVASISPGEDFVDATRRWIEQAAIVLVLIGPDWRPERLFDPGDFVRLELLTARELDKQIVPVLHDHRSMPGPSELPAEVAWLTTISAFALAAPPDHRRSLRQLVELLRSRLPANAISRPGGADHPRSGSLDPLTGGVMFPNLKSLINNPFGRKEPR